MNQYEKVMRDFGAVAVELAKARKQQDDAYEVASAMGKTIESLELKLAELGRLMRTIAIETAETGHG